MDKLARPDQDDPQEPSAPHAPAGPAPRRPYQPPQLLWSEPFQPVAYGMACGKISGISEKCNAFPQLS